MNERTNEYKQFTRGRVIVQVGSEPVNYLIGFSLQCCSLPVTEVSSGIPSTSSGLYVCELHYNEHLFICSSCVSSYQVMGMLPQAEVSVKEQTQLLPLS
jgi:hypothetical protein